MLTLEEVLRHFDPGKRQGKEYRTRCPAHEDQHPSLDISEGYRGIVFCCRTHGCQVSDILAAARLTWRDVLPESNGNGQSFPRKVIYTATFVDEHGTPLYKSLRYHPKDFALQAADGSWSVQDIRRVLYRLNQLSGHPSFCYTEGPQKADALWRIGLPATTHVGGAKGWRPHAATYTNQLLKAGVRSLAVLLDADAAGQQLGLEIAASVTAAGVRVRLVELPGLGPKQDILDFLAAGHGKEDVLAAIHATPQWEPVTVQRKPVTEPQFADTSARLQTFIRRYVVLNDEQATLATLWAMLTHAIDAFEFVPYLHILSPTAECGKSRLLEVLRAVVANPWLTGRVTAAVLMRKVDQEKPTLLLDEGDAAFNGDKEYSEALRGQLNAGFQRNGVASCCVGQGAKMTYKDFSVFGPKAIAGIGRLPSTVESRSIPIALKRRRADEPIQKWRHREAGAAATVLREQLSEMLAPHIETLRQARPSMPDGLSDRAEDVLEPLFALADLAGGDWPKRARDAAVTLMSREARADRDADQNIALELLADIQAVFKEREQPEAIATKSLIEGLVGLEDRPWSTFWKNEKPITGSKLASLLKRFDIRPAGQLWIEGRNVKGYRRVVFEDAFARYLVFESLDR